MMHQRRIDGYQPVHGTFHHHGLRACDHFGLMMVAAKIKGVAGLKQTLLKARKHQGGVAFGDLRHQHAHRHRVAPAQ